MTTVDNMAVMPMPKNFPPGVEVQALISLGLRAAWLHMHLTGTAAAALSPRDREILTLVATRPQGIAQQDLVDQLRLRGVSTVWAAVRYVDRLIADGWLHRRGGHSDAVIDLPVQDSQWIASHASRVKPQ